MICDSENGLGVDESGEQYDVTVSCMADVISSREVYGKQTLSIAL